MRVGNPLRFLTSLTANCSLFTASISCYIFPMSVTQTIDIPVSRRLVIDVPREVPVGRTVLTFTPAPQSPLHPCPICAAHIDPVTGNPRYNAETVAAIEEGMAISRGEIPVKWHKPHEFEKVWQDLLSGGADG